MDCAHKARLYLPEAGEEKASGFPHVYACKHALAYKVGPNGETLVFKLQGSVWIHRLGQEAAMDEEYVALTEVAVELLKETSGWKMSVRFCKGV